MLTSTYTFDTEVTVWGDLLNEFISNKKAKNCKILIQMMALNIVTYHPSLGQMLFWRPVFC